MINKDRFRKLYENGVLKSYFIDNKPIQIKINEDWVDVEDCNVINEIIGFRDIRVKPSPVNITKNEWFKFSEVKPLDYKKDILFYEDGCKTTTLVVYSCSLKDYYYHGSNKIYKPSLNSKWTYVTLPIDDDIPF